MPTRCQFSARSAGAEVNEALLACKGVCLRVENQMNLGDSATSVTLLDVVHRLLRHMVHRGWVGTQGQRPTAGCDHASLARRPPCCELGVQKSGGAAAVLGLPSSSPWGTVCSPRPEGGPARREARKTIPHESDLRGGHTLGTIWFRFFFKKFNMGSCSSNKSNV